MCLVIPSIFAPSVTVSPSASRQSRLIERPGCGALGEVLDIVSDRLEIGHLIPRFLVKYTARLFLEHAAPLLEEKRDAASYAIVAYFAHPVRLHGSGTGS